MRAWLKVNYDSLDDMEVWTQTVSNVTAWFNERCQHLKTKKEGSNGPEALVPSRTRSPAGYSRQCHSWVKGHASRWPGKRAAKHLSNISQQTDKWINFLYIQQKSHRWLETVKVKFR